MKVLKDDGVGPPIEIADEKAESKEEAKVESSAPTSSSNHGPGNAVQAA